MHRMSSYIRNATALVAASLLTLTLIPGPASARVDGDPTDLPVLGKAVPLGTVSYEQSAAVARTAKVVDGDISDWTGTSSMYGGTTVYSGGELVYQDHIFDAYGPDDGRDAERFARTDPIEEVLPEAYRIDGLAQADPSGELGIPVPEQYHYDDTYGDAVGGLQTGADLLEVRLAPQDVSTALLARTTTMRSDSKTALLVLVDNGGDEVSHSIPFGSGISSATADAAYFLTGNSGLVADLTTGAISLLPSASVATNDSDYTNAIEASLPFALEGASVAVASGTSNDSFDGFAPIALERNNETAHSNLANVAFRTAEPVRVWFERQQALALHSGSIDEFFTTFDSARATGDETLVPGFGYHDRLFISSQIVAQEGGRDGLFQHYGVFLPSSYQAGTATPLQWWLHWRGGTAHSGAGVVPKFFKQMGEDVDSIVVAPSGRGTSTWYVGRGQVDFQDVWGNVMDTFSIDRQRVYLSGHSMGGWGTYLLALLYPDRFAAGAPAAGPVTQGAWTGVDYFDGCDEMRFDEYTPCYISANGSDPRAQHTRKILENLRYVPMAIMHGTDDELVPYSGVARQAQRLQELGYRYRFYTYPGYEHYSHPIVDQWAEQANYMHSFVSPENPSRVTYIRDMPFERATESVQSNGIPLDFSFDSAYWMSKLTATDEMNGQASFDAVSFGIPEQPHTNVPEAAGPASLGSTGPFVMAGQTWIPTPTSVLPPSENRFSVRVSQARLVQLDLDRMQLNVAQPITATVDTGDALELQLAGSWTSSPLVLVDDVKVPVEIVDGVASIQLAPGVHSLKIDRHGQSRRPPHPPHPTP
jgi:pimeloyl-ACP methyl ester carboxylesterase